MEKLTYFLSSLFLFGPGGFLFSLTFLVQVACMRHQWWRTEAKLAIIFTRFFSSFFLHLLLFTHFRDTQETNFFSSPPERFRDYIFKTQTCHAGISSGN